MSVSRQGFRIVFWNVIMLASFFLPAFILGMGATVVWMGYPLAPNGFLSLPLEAIVFGVGMLGPLLPGVLLYSGILALLLALNRTRPRLLQLSALVLAPLVPATPIVLGFVGWMLLSKFVLATGLATLVFGIATAQIVVPMLTVAQPISGPMPK